jgi:hypothetical protein
MCRTRANQDPGTTLQLRLSAVALVKFGIIIRRPKHMVGSDSAPLKSTHLHDHLVRPYADVIISTIGIPDLVNSQAPSLPWSPPGLR